jgi:hypothetical protein
MNLSPVLKQPKKSKKDREPNSGGVQRRQIQSKKILFGYSCLPKNGCGRGAVVKQHAALKSGRPELLKDAAEQSLADNVVPQTGTDYAGVVGEGGSRRVSGGSGRLLRGERCLRCEDAERASPTNCGSALGSAHKNLWHDLSPWSRWHGRGSTIRMGGPVDIPVHATCGRDQGQRQHASGESGRQD